MVAVHQRWAAKQYALQKFTSVFALLARLEALEGETQNLKTDLQQARAELAATRSELAGSKVNLDQRLQEHTSHCVDARETAVKDELQQLVGAAGSSLEHLSRRCQGQQYCDSRGARHRSNQQACRPHTPCEGQARGRGSTRGLNPCTISVCSGSQPHWQTRQQQEGSFGGVFYPLSQTGVWLSGAGPPPQGRDRRPPLHGLTPLAPLPKPPHSRRLPANNNEASILFHFWYGMLRASQKSRQSCMRHGHTLHSLMLLCFPKPRLLLFYISSYQTIQSILSRHPQLAGVARVYYWQSGGSFLSP